MLLIVAGLVSACANDWTPEEELTLQRIRPMRGWLWDYFSTLSYYPESVQDLLEWNGRELPDTPYTGRPMVALADREFDPDRSPGNFHYEPVRHSGQNVGYLLYVFGEDGVLVILNPNVAWERLRELDD
jgi:hypothetical protein